MNIPGPLSCHRPLLTGLLAVLLGIITCFPTAAAETQVLPRITVSPDGRTFQTSTGKPFVPCGVNYYRPGTGWAPQVWKQFDPDATRRDFTRLKKMNMNCVRVFLSYGSFYRKPGVLEPEGLMKFDEFLSIAEQAGIYVHPTGPDHWEGSPEWRPVTVADAKTVQALEQFWELFAARYQGRNVIFAYDLKNEPEVAWKSDDLTQQWREWLQKAYDTQAALAKAWDLTNRIQFANASVPEDESALNSKQLLDYQRFRESLADEWTSRQVAAIKRADPNALVTVGLIQWSVPSLLPAGPRHYSAFNPQRQARFLDFLEIHFYPLESGSFGYRDRQEEDANLAYLEGILRETARQRKPVVLAEFGWFGGGKPTFARNLPEVSETAHARFCHGLLEVSRGWVVGWLNWGYYDHPQARDCSQLTGLLTSDGRIKEWGTTFQQWATNLEGKQLTPPKIGPRPDLNWSACITSREAGDAFRKSYLQAFLKDRSGQEKTQP